MHELPFGLGPHEGKELELMLFGKKHITMLECVYEEFEPYLRSGQFKYIAHDEWTHIIYIPDYEKEAQAFIKLIDESRVRGFVADLERKIGRALGYSEREVDVYLRHISELLVE